MDDARSVHGDNVEDINDSHDIDWDRMGSTRPIQFPPLDGNIMFHVMIAMLKLNGLFVGQAHEKPHEHHHNFVVIFLPFIIRGVT